MPEHSYTFNAVAIVHSCFKEKFGIPRQPGLVDASEAQIELLPPYDREETLRGLEEFSHLWLVFVFHQHLKQDWKATVRPPRLGGNQRIGVYASRAPYRPNPIGMSVVKLKSIEKLHNKILIHVSGIDLLDGTPILDIKPYVPYTDAIPDAGGAYAQLAPQQQFIIELTDDVDQFIDEYADEYPNLRLLITQVISADPRPGYYDKHNNKTSFGIRLYDFNIRWEIEGHTASVYSIEPIID